ncbi:uncharacterized protein KGF55_003706 [Candida pseudojiufengensis]|uniref:uncharacterized protein n=1 Tax=Candida pseudojiufengensis TaxID=497109 RepID=UPI0022251C07|nr:uncharacterized protein KGF55_003706 [Candida pseudojiufengensis]KAI5962630.1 hypothetical protein KGF55_003706 [Candida pseudojiufengensis]
MTSTTTLINPSIDKDNENQTNINNYQRVPLKTSVIGQQTQSKQEIINNLLNLAKQEQAKGNSSITSDKIDKLQTILSKKQKEEENSSNKFKKFQNLPTIKKQVPKYPPLFNKFDIDSAIKTNHTSPNPTIKETTSKSPSKSQSKKSNKKFYSPKKFTFKQLEYMFINFLENIANLLDNLHLLSNLPMFPKFLNNLLKQTNKLWILILIFLIRKTISQLLNVIRKIRKINVEKTILNNNSPIKTNLNDDINKKYNKILKDLKFDKMMLILELIGNLLDFIFNLIELNSIGVPDWVMSGLNFASMAMTIYRMNKDDEYIDDDITEDLI